MNGLDKIRVSKKILEDDIYNLIQDVWREWCFNALKDYDDSVYQGIIRGVVRLDSKELKGYKCFVQKRLIKKEKYEEVLGRLIQANDIEVIESAYGGSIKVMGRGFIKENGLKLEQHQVLVYATTQVAVRLLSVDEVIEEIKRR